MESSEMCHSIRMAPFGPENTILPQMYEKWADAINNFEVRNDDVYVMGSVKTGTTWTQELVWCLANNLDFNLSKNIPVDKKFPVLELCAFPKQNEEVWLNDSINYCRILPSPRLIKTHLPWSLIPKQIQSGEVSPKIVYVHREPKDTCVSMYTYTVRMGFYSGTFEQMCEEMVSNKVIYAPFWKHVNGFLARQHLKNLLVISYEELNSDLRSVVQKVAAFLEKSLTESEVDALCRHLGFDSMKENVSVNTRNIGGKDIPFLGTGTTGSHKKYMSPEMIERFDQWTKENRM